MSNAYIEAADAIRRAAKQYELFVQAAEVLARAGSFEQAAREAEAAAAKAKGERDAYLKELEDARVSVRNERGKAKQARDEAAGKAAEIVEAAKKEAVAAADAIREQATAQAVEAKARAEAAARKAQEQLQELNDECADLSTKAKVLRAEIAGLSKDRDAVAQALEALRAKFA